MDFNLVNEAWIPVLYADGEWRRVGIRKALEDAHLIRQIAATNPMDRVALLRFLLAVLYWCRGNPTGLEEKDRILAEGRFPANWFGKLEDRRECFNLLGDGKRLYQDSTAKRERPATDLLQEIPTGNNFWHFRHSTDGGEGMCASCCAMGLLRLPLFSVSGLPDLKAGINGTPPIYVVPVGQSLLHTLCLNWVSCESLGHPVWEKPDFALVKGTPVPLLNGLTMLSRRVWLHTPTSADGLCIGCGRQSALIQSCEYQSAGEQQNKDWSDPHVSYLQKKAKDGSTSRKALTTPDLTKSFFRMDKPWTSLFMLVSASLRSRVNLEPLHLFVVGFATDKAKNIDVWERVWTIPPATEGQHSAAAEMIALWNEEGKKLAVRLKPNGSTSHDLEFVVATTAIRPHVESQVSGRVADLLTNPEQSSTKAVEEYRRMITAVATSLAPGFTTRSLDRRRQIANTLPRMAAQPTSKSRKSRAKKEGNQ